MMEAAIHVKPFGFDRIFHIGGGESSAFDTDPPDARVDALHARIAALEAEHQEALARASADAFAAGLAQAREERDAALLMATDAIHAAIDDIDARLTETTERFMRDAAEVAFAAAEMLAGHAIDAAPTRAIDEALDRVLQQVARGTRLSVRVHPALLAPIEQRIAARQQNERRKLAIIAIGDADLAEGDAVIFWDEGGLAVDAAARRAAVIAEIGPLMPKAPQA
jgi:flagellar assembly protein FliH